jgi:hypothetical protein
MGLLLQNLAGRDILITESMAQYQHANPVFRVASAPQAEARMWMVSGMAGSIHPWWHHIGAYHEDRRQYRTAQPIYDLHAKYDKYLAHREAVAPVGVLWSQGNVDFYGRDAAEVRTQHAWHGVVRALTRNRIPYTPIHIDHLDRNSSKLRAVVLPALGAMSDAQCDSVRRFAAEGGGVVAFGETSLYDEWGESRGDFGLADLFNASHRGASLGLESPTRASFEDDSSHTYMRLSPENRGNVYGPMTGAEPVAGDARRHPVLEGFDETDLLPFGGKLEAVTAGGDAWIPLSYVAPFPIYPPELSWMRNPKTSSPAAVCTERAAGGRVAYFAGDIDRCYGRDNLPDHGRLIANAVRWAVADELPLRLEGAGFIDCRLYSQPGRLICHLVNLTNDGAWRGPIHELAPTGPFELRLRLPESLKKASARTLVIEGRTKAESSGDWLIVQIPSILDHEIVVVEQ